MKRKIIHAVTLILGLSLFSFYAKAQNWQAYKGVWLKGYDNAPQAPLPPSGYSALTYFADSLGTYVYDWDSLAWLRIPGTGGGGGGGITTADNGLTVNPAGNVRLGGSMSTSSTIISGNGLLPVLNFGNGFGSTGRFGSMSFITGTSSTTEAVLTVSGLSGNAAISGQTEASSSVHSNFQFSPTAQTFNIINGSSTTTANITNGQYAFSSSTGSRINFNVATPASPLITTQAAENFTISKPLGLASSSGSLQIGGPDGFVTSLENTESGNTAIFDVRGTNETFSMRSGSGGSTLTTNVSTPNIVTHTLTTPGTSILGEHHIRNSNSADHLALVVGPPGGTAPVTSQISINSQSGTFGTITATGASGTFQLVASDTLIITAGNDYLFTDVDGTNRSVILEGDQNNLRLRANGNDGFTEITAETSTSNTSSMLIHPGFHANGGSEDLILTTRNVNSANDAGDVIIRPGTNAGAGNSGTITIDALTGFLIISNIPTSDPCGSAPGGTVWNNSGVLNICP